MYNVFVASSHITRNIRKIFNNIVEFCSIRYQTYYLPNAAMLRPRISWNSLHSYCMIVTVESDVWKYQDFLIKISPRPCRLRWWCCGPFVLPLRPLADYVLFAQLSQIVYLTCVSLLVDLTHATFNHMNLL